MALLSDHFSILRADIRSQYVPMELKGYMHWFDPYTSWKWESPTAYREILHMLYDVITG